MSLFEQLSTVTTDLLKCLERGLPNEKREAYLEELNKLLDKRQSLLDDLPKPKTKEEQEIGIEIYKTSKEIEKYMQVQKASIKQDIIQLKNQKQKSGNYANPYANQNADGMFFDKRK